MPFYGHVWNHTISKLDKFWARPWNKIRIFPPLVAALVSFENRQLDMPRPHPNCLTFCEACPKRRHSSLSTTGKKGLRVFLMTSLVLPGGLRNHRSQCPFLCDWLPYLHKFDNVPPKFGAKVCFLSVHKEHSKTFSKAYPLPVPFLAAI